MSTIKLKKNIEIEQLDKSKIVYDKKDFELTATIDTNQRSIVAKLVHIETRIISRFFQHTIQLSEEGEEVIINEVEVNQYNDLVSAKEAIIKRLISLIDEKEGEKAGQPEEILNQIQQEIELLQVERQEQEQALQNLYNNPVEPIVEFQNSWGEFWDQFISKDENGLSINDKGLKLIRSKIPLLSEAI